MPANAGDTTVLMSDSTGFEVDMLAYVANTGNVFGEFVRVTGVGAGSVSFAQVLSVNQILFTENFR